MREERIKKLIIETISDKSLMIEDIAANSGLSISTVRRYLITLKAERKAYIAEWVPVAWQYVRLYRAGSLPDQPKPKEKIEYEPPKVEPQPVETLAIHQTWDRCFQRYVRGHYAAR